MKKRFLTIALALIMVLACAFNVIACGGSSSSSSKDGTYYLYSNGEYDEESYVKISGNKVTDFMEEGDSYKSAGAKFKTTISGKSISVTISGLEDGNGVYSGEINNGVIHLTRFETYDENGNLKQNQGYDYYFCKKGKTPSDLDGNGGSGSGNGGNNGDSSELVDYAPEGFVPNNYPVDSSFKGAVSKQSYSSQNAAAQAFLSNEISGEATQPSFVSYTTKSTLSTSEISKFDIEVSSGSRITSAECGEIEYQDNSNVSAKNASKAGDVFIVKTKKLTIYIFVIDMTDYKYFAPELNKGDIITKSYYDDVFDQSKYVNCTITETASSSSVSRQKYGNMTLETSGTYSASATVKLTEDATYCIATQEMTTYMNGSLMESSSSTAELYIEYTDGEISKMYTRVNGGEWKRATSSSVDIRQYTTPKMDNSYFIKTDYGFTINSEKFSQYVQKQINSISSNNNMGITYDELSASAAFLVKDGKLDQIKTTVDGSYSMSGITGTTSGESLDVYSNFGTTTVPSKSSLGINN